MVRIRFRRIGGRNQASYRIVATDKESPVKGRFIDVLGFYNPRTEPATIQLDEGRIYDWMKRGASPSDSVMQVFKLAGLASRYERFKSGEKLEALLAEAEAAKGQKVNVKTQRPAPVKATRKKKSKDGEAAPAAPAAAPATAAAKAPKTE